MKTVNVKSLGNCPYLVSLEPEDIIGHGSYAQVLRAYNKNHQNQKLAVKIFKISEPKKINSALCQLNVMNTLPKHPNLVEFKKIKITSKNYLYIIMQLCQKSLHKEIIQRKQSLTQQAVWQFINQFVEGYKILYKRNIIHRDIKPQNILIGFDGKYKITDFGLSSIVENSDSEGKIKGSPIFMAPELFLKDGKSKINNLNDVYSFGVTLYFLCFKSFPFISQNERKFKVKNVQNMINLISKNKICIPANNFSPQLNSLIREMLEKNPSKRCSWEYIFYLLLKKFNKENEADQQLNIQSQAQTSLKFRIIEISDAFLKNLSQLDTDLYKSIKNESIAIIDHIEADILSKRQFVFFCDRIYARMEIIISKKSDKVLNKFSKSLLQLNYLHSKALLENFEKHYSRIEKNQFLKLITSKKYSCIKSLIQQDFHELSSLLESFQITARRSLNIVSAQVYEYCSDVIQNLYKYEQFEECLHVNELQKWFEDCSDCLLKRLRKNENALKQFILSIFGMGKIELRERLGYKYTYIFTN